MFADVLLADYGLENPAAVVQADDDGSRAEDLGDFDFGRWVEAVHQRVEKLVGRAEEGELDRLDEAIGHLEKLENELKRVRIQLRLTLDRAAQLRGHVSQMSSGIRSSLEADMAQVEESVQQILSPVDAVLRCYRDGRWSLMAIQAKKEPEGEAPIFDDADALLAFLQE